MSVVLVLEPDGAQAEQLLRVLRKRVRAEAILVKSTAAAIEVIDNQTPDLILLTALLSPRDEDRLMGHLRSLEGAAHLLAGQVLADIDVETVALELFGDVARIVDRLLQRRLGVRIFRVADHERIALTGSERRSYRRD